MDAPLYGEISYRRVRGAEKAITSVYEFAPDSMVTRDHGRLRFRLGLQVDFDLEAAKRTLAGRLEREVRPVASAA